MTPLLENFKSKGFKILSYAHAYFRFKASQMTNRYQARDLQTTKERKIQAKCQEIMPHISKLLYNKEQNKTFLGKVGQSLRVEKLEDSSLEKLIEYCHRCNEATLSLSH